MMTGTTSRFVLSLLVAPLLLAGFTARSNDWDIPTNRANFHVFLLMGQSNMAGAAGMLPGDEKPVPGIVYLPTVATNGFAWLPAAHPLNNRLAANRGVGPGLSFAEEYRRTHPGVTVGLINVAWGGANIANLMKGSVVYGDGIAKARWAANQGVISGVLWHQGESDTVTKPLADTYEGKLDRMIRHIRDDLALPHLPFVAGQLADFYGTGPEHNAPERVAQIATVQAALTKLPKRMQHTASVSSSGLKSMDWHNVHFDRASYIEFGKRYAAALQSLETPTKAP